MAGTQENNMRIAKNTLLLYARMAVLMLVSLYTSRVVLDELGVEDYGIYNVVGGIVAMFGFLNTAMSSATQRYITFALGKCDEKSLSNVFNTSMQIHILIAVIILVLAETCGLWFLKTQMNIPPNRETAAFWVYQSSIISTVVLILSVPYNATIIAHERMSAFAYISIVEASLKLAIAFALTIWSNDKLIFYAVLLVAVQIIIRIIYGNYCSKYFKESKMQMTHDRILFKEMLSFAGWNLWGNAAAIAFTQGLNILLNIFFTPAVNASRAVAVQVQSAVQQFSANFQMAMNPQITKSYAKEDLSYMHSLIFRSSKFTFILLFILSLPILLETEQILRIWLKIVPEYSEIFLRIILCLTIIDAMANPLVTAAQATGKVKLYQSVIGGIQIMILPISYVVLKLGGEPYSVFIVHLLICLIAFIARLIIVKPLINLSLGKYFREVILRCMLLFIVASIIPIYLHISLPSPAIGNFLLVCLMSVVSVGGCSYFIGLNKSERSFINSKVTTFFQNIRNDKNCR